MITSSTVVNSVVEKLRAALARGQWRSGEMLRNSPEHLAERLEENETVVRAIRNKNSALASAEMRRHILQEGQRMGIELNIPDDNLGK